MQSALMLFGSAYGQFFFFFYDQLLSHWKSRQIDQVVLVLLVCTERTQWESSIRTVLGFLSRYLKLISHVTVLLLTGLDDVAMAIFVFALFSFWAIILYN